MGNTQGLTYQNSIKRLLDIIASLFLIVICFIPGIIIALLIKLTSKGPIFFKQLRVGKNGQLFYIYKFRSMSINAPHQKSTSEFNEANRYITKVGHFIRKTSIDELPQLFNVLNGKMSIVGPRPLIPEEKRINQQRHQLKIDHLLPGITGLAQVNGRDRITNRNKLAYDYQYYQNISLSLDAKIIFTTIKKVLMRKDIKDD